MREIIITKNEEGMKLRRLCMNFLSEAPASFIYKMLRKKNIVLNGRKSDGNEILSSGDIVRMCLSDETISGFQKKRSYNNTEYQKPDIIYEDRDVIICNKPEGILSQKADPGDYSINEMIIDYLLDKGDIDNESMKLFRPSICNRLDRNTCGIIMAAKTPAGAHFLSAILRDRSLSKYYMTVVAGRCRLNGRYTAYLVKDRSDNRVKIISADEYREAAYPDAKMIQTNIQVLDINEATNLSLLRIELITGKSHQIRSHLAYLGHPILGDYKYGDRRINKLYKDRYNIQSQLLCAYEVVFPDESDVTDDVRGYIRDNSLFGRTISITPPDIFRTNL